MADNKFLLRLKGKQINKSSVQINEDKLTPVFSNMPVGSDGLQNIIDQSKSSVVVAKGSQNWYLSGDSLILSDDDQYVSEYKANGQGLWIDSSYSFTSASVVAPGAKWVLRLCGDNLLNYAEHRITLSAIIKSGSTVLATKTFSLEEQANFFCKVLEFDFSDTYQSVHKFAAGSTLTVQLLCGSDDASATIYNGKTTLTLLQRMVDADTVAFNGTPLIDVMAGYQAHVEDTDNPHNVTKAQVGLGNADNTADADKPISTATQSALDAKQATLVSGTNIKTVNSTSLLGSGNIAVQATITGGATTITSSNLTANRALVSNASGKVAVSAVTSTELGYLDGVTSAIQTQLNGKATSSDITSAISTHNSSSSAHSDIRSAVAELKDLSNITADGKGVIAHNTMPSDRYITLTLGASGSTYTAPADGWIYWNGDFATTSGHIRINSSKIGSATQANAVTATKLARIFIPVSKDDSVTVAYNDVNSTYTFNFIYSQGAQ